MHQNAIHLVVGIARRLVDKVKESCGQTAIAHAADLRRQLHAHIRLTSGIHSIEQFNKSLVRQLRQRFTDGQANQLTIPDHLPI